MILRVNCLWFEFLPKPTVLPVFGLRDASVYGVLPMEALVAYACYSYIQINSNEMEMMCGTLPG